MGTVGVLDAGIGELVKQWLSPDSVNRAVQGQRRRAKQRRRLRVCAVGADRTWANWLCATFDAAGYAVRTETWPSARIRDLERLARNERNLLVLSTFSAESPEFISEQVRQVTTGRNRKRLLVIRVESVEVPAELGEVQLIDLAGTADATDAGSQVINELRRLRWPHRFSSEASPGVRYPGEGPDPEEIGEPADHFAGRAELLDRLRSKLLAPERVTERRRSCVLYGLPGMGKTETALQFALRFRTHYDLIWLIKAGETQGVGVEVDRLARRLVGESETDQLPRVLGRKHCLLILDDMTDPEFLHKPDWNWIRRLGRGTVLITSQYQVWGNDVDDSLAVNRLSTNEALAFINDRLPAMTGSAEEIKEETACRREIVEELGGLPLALEQAVAALKGRTMSTQQYRKDLRENLSKRLEVPGEDRPVIATLELALNRLRTAPDVESPGELLLNALAFLAPEGIPRQLLVEQAEPLPDTLRAVVSDVDDYGSAIAALRAFSLIYFDEEKREFSVHRLVQAVVRDRLGERAGTWAEALIRVVANAFPVDPRNPDRLEESEVLLPQALAVRHFDRYAGAHPELFALLARAGDFLELRENHSGAADVLEQAERLAGDSGSADLAGVRIALCRAYFGLARLDDAEHAARRALWLLRDLFEGDNAQTAEALTWLGTTYLEQGKLAKSVDTIEQSLAILERLYAADDARVGDALAFLGRAQWRAGRLAAASETFARALAILESPGTPPSGKAGGVYLRLALTLRDLGDPAALDRARQAAERAREIFERLNAHNPAEVARADAVRADIARLRGDLPASESLIADAVRTLGEIDPDHPNMAMALEIAGSIKQANRQFDDAVANLERASQIFARVYQPEHPYNAEALCRLGATRRDQGEFADAEQKLEQALRLYENAYGKDYPHNALVLEELAELRRRQNRDADAATLLARAHSLREVAASVR